LLETQIASAKSDAKTTRQLASEIAQLTRAQHFPTQQKQQNASVLAALDGMAQALPDDGWADEVDVTDHDITVLGQAKDAARLLSLVDANPLFYGAEFRAPIVAGDNGAQKFHLSAHLVDTQHAKP
jgi:general secretion pathway protein L